MELNKHKYMTNFLIINQIHAINVEYIFYYQLLTLLLADMIQLIIRGYLKNYLGRKVLGGNGSKSSIESSWNSPCVPFHHLLEAVVFLSVLYGKRKRKRFSTGWTARRRRPVHFWTWVGLMEFKRLWASVRAEHDP